MSDEEPAKPKALAGRAVSVFLDLRLGGNVFKCPRVRTMSSSPLYREYPPGPRLAEVVECFWTSWTVAAVGTRAFHRVLPDGCMDLLFDFRAGGERRAAVIGTMRTAQAFTTTGAVDLLGVRFRPGGLPALVAMDAAELTDVRAELGNFFGTWAQETWHRLGELTPERRVAMLRRRLEQRVAGRQGPDVFVAHCAQRITATRGAMRLEELERSTGLSERQLERKFAQAVGVSPKLFARVMRFAGVAAAATRRPEAPVWAELAAEFGYADQAHLTREFKAFAGLPPGEFLTENRASGQGRRHVGNLQDSPCGVR